MRIPVLTGGATVERTVAFAGASALSGLQAPALGQKRELSFLSWNHFVPASDDELRKQAEAFGKRNAVRGELLVRLRPEKIIALAGISD